MKAATSPRRAALWVSDSLSTSSGGAYSSDCRLLLFEGRLGLASARPKNFDVLLDLVVSLDLAVDLVVDLPVIRAVGDAPLEMSEFLHERFCKFVAESLLIEILFNDFGIDFFFAFDHMSLRSVTSAIRSTMSFSDATMA
mmetsp:Transcript_34977/g.102523  ORF Transcript_34977/g.102523 Transcript_34977/m.102523 type:complete len:140 (-) Transcript_34977:2258-2677(-)